MIVLGPPGAMPAFARVEDAADGRVRVSFWNWPRRGLLLGAVPIGRPELFDQPFHFVRDQVHERLWGRGR